MESPQTMGIHHSPHTHPTPIPMGIPIPTAALVFAETSTPIGILACFLLAIRQLF